MENASKALIMAAGVLIGVIILSLGVYLFQVMGGYSANTQSEMDRTKLNQFNDKFLRYNGMSDLTIQDLVTIKNYALESNKESDGYNYSVDRAADNNGYIDVYFGKTKNTSSLVFDKTDEKLLQDEIQKLKENEGMNPKRFTCEVLINTNTGRVNKVYFFQTSS